MLHVLRPVYISYIHTSVAKTLVCFSNTNSCVFPYKNFGNFVSLSLLFDLLPFGANAFRGCLESDLFGTQFSAFFQNLFLYFHSSCGPLESSVFCECGALRHSRK
jgi:hypothetical protein